jgi:hypothetical protein
VPYIEEEYKSKAILINGERGTKEIHAGISEIILNPVQ